MEFEFDKFIEDIKLREERIKSERRVSDHVREEDERRRLRNEQYNERWQNRIVWERNNEPWFIK